MTGTSDPYPSYVCNCGEAFRSPWERLAHWQGCEANTERREPPQFTSIPETVKVLVCGGRDYTDASAVNSELSRLNPDCVLQGGCPTGADRFAREWAARNETTCETFVANWHEQGPAAGPIRNQRMIDFGKPDLVLAFPGGRGTADMVRRAQKAGIKVIEFRENTDQ